MNKYQTSKNNRKKFVWIVFFVGKDEKLIGFLDEIKDIITEGEKVAFD